VILTKVSYLMKQILQVKWKMKWFKKLLLLFPDLQFYNYFKLFTFLGAFLAFLESFWGFFEIFLGDFGAGVLHILGGFLLF